MENNWKWGIAQWAELKWWKSYLAKKDTTEYLNWKKDYWHNFLKTIEANFSVPVDYTILDAGCGPAGIFTIFDKNSVTAIDPLLNNYETDLAQFSKAKYPEVEFIETSIENFKAEQQFDLIFCLNAINHVNDLKLSVKILYDSLKTKGKAYISIDAHNHQLLKRVFRAFPGDILHPHQHDLKDYIQVFQAAGFKYGKHWKVNKERIFSYYLVELEKL